MEAKKIARINELARKKREVGLTDEEMAERRALYDEYLAAYRENMRSMLDNLRVQNPDGSVEKLARKDDPKA